MYIISTAQPRYLNEVTGGVETRHHFYNTRWVCRGDTIAKDTLREYGPAVLIDGFWMTCVEVTNDLWTWYIRQSHEATDDMLLPLTGITPSEADSFCIQLNLSTHGSWRLPTKEEWLFAFSGGLFSERYRYAGSDNADRVAWYSSNSGGRKHIGGQRIPNELGLYDLSGNVAEMVTDGNKILVLGGCYLDDLSSRQTTTSPPHETIGFRVVMHEPLWFDKYGQKIRPIQPLN